MSSCKHSFTLSLGNGNTMRVDCLRTGILRIRMGVGDCQHESGLNRYGIIRIQPDLAGNAPTLTTTENGWALTTPEVQLHIQSIDGQICVQRANGEKAVERITAAINGKGRGFRLDFSLHDQERLYGLGDVDRQCLQRRGKTYEMAIKNVTAYMPIPFLMSSAGWAVLMNTTWFHTVDAGASCKEILSFHADNGFLDYYLIVGEFPGKLLNRYTEITGNPTLLPAWAYGLTFVCDERGTRARDVLYEAYEFRRQGIPCDIIGLEPNWMENRYDFSTAKEWSKERFHIPLWLKGKDHSTFCAALKNMGFKLSLWLCCDYDLSEYEERQRMQKAAADPSGTATAPLDGALIEDHRLVGAKYMDTLTKPGEPWFEHLKKFVDDGARAFKMDGADQVRHHPDRRWANGMDDREMHNLYPLLLAKQMSRGFAEYTKRRPMINTPCGYAGIQQYAASWAGDTGGGKAPLISLLNHGLCAHSNVTTDMEVWDAAGIHFGFFQAWSQVLSWHMYNQPWFQTERCAALFKNYARLRYRLLPYIYSMAYLAHRRGMPIMRAMPLAFPNEPGSDNLLFEYMFGDALLTAAFAETIYLPNGVWFDYWTGKKFSGPATLPVSPPPEWGGPLFARAGAIIPQAPEMDYWGQKPFDTLRVEIFPGNRHAPFVLYEDDGETERYQAGAFATTTFQQRIEAQTIFLTIGPRTGQYEGMPHQRRYQLEVHCPEPRMVAIDQTRITDYQYDAAKAMLTIPPLPAAFDKTIEINIVFQ